MSTAVSRPLNSEKSSRTSTGESGRRQVLQIRDLLNGVLLGKADVIDAVLVCLLSRGHLLLEDKPGLGKTTLAKSLAAALGGNFARVQCTPDLLPSDITGFNIFNQQSREFEFRRGPVFSDVLLTDEINRATPRTQSALLEAMAERQVTVDAEQYQLAPEFFVIATQNPIDQHGTYPLPEAQLDRFAMKISIGYPGRSHELQMLRDDASGATEARTTATDLPFLAPGELRQIQSQVGRLAIADSLQGYLVDLGAATRQHPQVTLGLSPRGLIVWQRAAQAQAYLRHRDFVTPDDIQDVALPVLSVRLGIRHDDPAPVIRELLASVSLPSYTGSS